MPDVAFEDREDVLSWTETRLWPQFQSHRQAEPDGVALVDCDDRLWTRSELGQMADLIAEDLRRSGVGAGDRVLVAGHKTAATLAAALAISALEAVFCPYSTKLGASELAAIEAALGHTAKVVCEHGARWTIRPAPTSERSRDPRDAQTVLIGFTSGSTGVPKE